MRKLILKGMKWTLNCGQRSLPLYRQSALFFERLGGERGWCTLGQSLEDVGFEVTKKRERGLLVESVAIRYRS
jgi:hypothetical protein